MAKNKTLKVELSQLEIRFIFKAIAFTVGDARLPVREKDLLTRISAGLYKKYIETFGEPTDKEMGKGTLHQPHCRANIGYVCSCVKLSLG